MEDYNSLKQYGYNQQLSCFVKENFNNEKDFLIYQENLKEYKEMIKQEFKKQDQDDQRKTSNSQLQLDRNEINLIKIKEEFNQLSRLILAKQQFLSNLQKQLFQQQDIDSHYEFVKNPKGIWHQTTSQSFNRLEPNSKMDSSLFGFDRLNVSIKKGNFSQLRYDQQYVGETYLSIHDLNKKLEKVDIDILLQQESNIAFQNQITELKKSILFSKEKITQFGKLRNYSDAKFENLSKTSEKATELFKNCNSKVKLAKQEIIGLKTVSKQLLDKRIRQASIGKDLLQKDEENLTRQLYVFNELKEQNNQLIEKVEVIKNQEIILSSRQMHEQVQTILMMFCELERIFLQGKEEEILIPLSPSRKPVSSRTSATFLKFNKIQSINEDRLHAKEIKIQTQNIQQNDEFLQQLILGSSFSPIKQERRRLTTIINSPSLLSRRNRQSNCIREQIVDSFDRKQTGNINFSNIKLEIKKYFIEDPDRLQNVLVKLTNVYENLYENLISLRLKHDEGNMLKAAKCRQLLKLEQDLLKYTSHQQQQIKEIDQLKIEQRAIELENKIDKTFQNCPSIKFPFKMQTFHVANIRQEEGCKEIESKFNQLQNVQQQFLLYYQFLLDLKQKLTYILAIMYKNKFELPNQLIFTVMQNYKQMILNNIIGKDLIGQEQLLEKSQQKKYVASVTECEEIKGSLNEQQLTQLYSLNEINKILVDFQELIQSQKIQPQNDQQQYEILSENNIIQMISMFSKQKSLKVKKKNIQAMVSNLKEKYCLFYFLSEKTLQQFQQQDLNQQMENISNQNNIVNILSLNFENIIQKILENDIVQKFQFQFQQLIQYIQHIKQQNQISAKKLAKMQKKEMKKSKSIETESFQSKSLKNPLLKTRKVRSFIKQIQLETILRLKQQMKYKEERKIQEIEDDGKELPNSPDTSQEIENSKEKNLSTNDLSSNSNIMSQLAKQQNNENEDQEQTNNNFLQQLLNKKNAQVKEQKKNKMIIDFIQNQSDQILIKDDYKKQFNVIQLHREKQKVEKEKQIKSQKLQQMILNYKLGEVGFLENQRQELKNLIGMKMEEERKKKQPKILLSSKEQKLKEWDERTKMIYDRLVSQTREEPFQQSLKQFIGKDKILAQVYAIEGKPKTELENQLVNNLENEKRKQRENLLREDQEANMKNYLKQSIIAQLRRKITVKEQMERSERDLQSKIIAIKPTIQNINNLCNSKVKNQIYFQKRSHSNSKRMETLYSQYSERDISANKVQSNIRLMTSQSERKIRINPTYKLKMVKNLITQQYDEQLQQYQSSRSKQNALLRQKLYQQLNFKIY